MHMIRTYDLKNKIRVSYTYDLFYSQHCYLLVPTGTVYDVTSASAYLTICSVMETSLICVKRHINCQGMQPSAYQYSTHLTKLRFLLFLHVRLFY